MKALVTRTLFPEVMDFLSARLDIEVGASDRNLAPEELLEKTADKDGLLCLLVDRVDRKVMNAAPRLKVIANCAAGTDNIHVAYAQTRGILVTNTPDVLTDATADLTLALMLAVARRLPQADRFTRDGRYKGWELDLFLGKELKGKRLGLIGLGRIGRAVALRAAGFGMETVYTGPRRLDEDAERTHRVSFLPLEELLSTSDIVSIHASLTLETRRLLSRERLALMKESAILINVARGPLVDERALAEALAQGKLWGAGLDVYEREPEVEEILLKLDNVVLLPHIGSATRETRLRMAMTAARNLVQGLSGKTPENLVG